MVTHVVEAGAVPPLRHPNYELRQELGRGSFGVVYRAFDKERSRDLAIKVLNDLHPRSLVDLRGELRARAEIHHPNLLQIYGLEVDGDRAFLTMELVEDAVSFVEYVRGGRAIPALPLSPEVVSRTARSTHSLISALHRLHGTGFVHRDVKPQNVLVNATTGDLRLADFGLAASAATLATKTISGYVYGTPAYLAPELLWGAPASPAADLYSAGVMLLEALTGQLPDIELASGTLGPTGLRGPLGALISGLLAPEPKGRLDAAAACQRLRTIAPDLQLPEITPTVGSPFVGRAVERDRVLATLKRESPAVIWIRGPSGIGKTTFVEQVLSSWTGRADGVVLRGRCHPQEHVRFRAWDEIAVQLARHVRRERIERVLAPSQLAALRQLFPVFEAGLSEAAPAIHDQAPDGDLRRVAVDAFRALLTYASSGRRLVIWIDDLQWANDDSLDLLADVLERGAGKTAWLLSHRHGDTSGEPEIRARLRAGRQTSSDDVDLDLGALDRRDVVKILRDLGVRESDVDKDTLGLLAALPMFAPELAASTTANRAAPEPATKQLDSLVARRVAGFDERRLRVLDTVAACPRPIPWTLLASAVERPSELFDDFLSLLQAGLLRRSQNGPGARVWTYHDLIREARLGSMPEALAAEIHHRLIRAHDEHAPDEHEVLAHHLERVGDGKRASRSLVSAAEQASKQLAFGSAAAHFDRAFALDESLKGDWGLQERRAECDASRGLSRTAGERFEQAARLRERSDGPSATLALRSRAARELILCGQISSGYDILRQLMARLGTTLPKDHLGTLGWSVALRGRLVVREPRRQEAAPATADARARLDALWTGCTSLSHINPALADVFLLRHLTLALQVGDPSHLAKALAFEAVAEATLGGSFLLRRSDALLARAQQVCETRKDDYDWAWFWTAKASRATFDCDWTAAVEHSVRAESYYEKRHHGVAWERSVARIYRAIALSMKGDIPALREVVTATADDARERDDPVAANGVTSGHPAILRLFDDAPVDEARRGAHRGLERGSRWPEVAFVAPDYYDMVAETERLLYENRARDALRRIEQDWKSLAESGLMRLRFVGVDARFLRARCALRAATDRSLGSRERGRLFDATKDEVRRVARSGEAIAQPYSSAMAAGLALLTGDRRKAMDAYDEAAQGFATRDMRAHEAAARRASATARMDGRAVESAEVELGALGARCPAKIAELLVPAPSG